MKGLLPLPITKMSGAGNTFSLIDLTNKSPWLDIEKQLNLPRAEFAKMICDKVLGLATDGLLFIQPGSEGFDFDWDFYNSDGSTAEMCGNAARCAARFCVESLGSASQINLKFKTGAGLVLAQTLGDSRVRVKMPAAKVLQEQIFLRMRSSSEETFTLINTGVPHLVQKIHEMGAAVALKDMAREARSHHDLKPNGANVTFYAEASKGRINAVTFERGVEDYTLACGTGAVAAALAYSNINGEKNVEVQMPGGLLQVNFIEGDPHPLMTGEAVFVGEFKYNLEVLV